MKTVNLQYKPAKNIFFTMEFIIIYHVYYQFYLCLNSASFGTPAVFVSSALWNILCYTETARKEKLWFPNISFFLFFIIGELGYLSSSSFLKSKFV